MTFDSLLMSYLYKVYVLLIHIKNGVFED